MTKKPRNTSRVTKPVTNLRDDGGVITPKWFAPPQQDLQEIIAYSVGNDPWPGGVITPKGIPHSIDVSGWEMSAMTNGGIEIVQTGNDFPDATIRLLCVHGIGDHHTSLAWKADWARTIAAGIFYWRPKARLEFSFFEHDGYFSGEGIKLVDVAEATIKLLASGLFHGAGDLFRPRGLHDLSDSLRWSAGMVAQWVANEKLRAALRTALLDRIQSANPHAICGHSLGSLVCYDTLVRSPGREVAKDRIFVSLGSQIGNPFVRSVFDGVVAPVHTLRNWFHLYNRHDDVLTAEVNLSTSNFMQIDTPFDDPGMGDHAATSYFSHAAVINQVWSRLANVNVTPAAIAASRGFEIIHRAGASKQRALLVGLNEYPDPAMRLEGCVNDAYLASSVLQEMGFEPEDIRVVFNDRATASGIRERLHWLLDGAGPGDQRVFFYSGHGAQLENYSLGERVDRKDECLVPYDFDWSLEKAVVDDWFYELYSQLDHGVSFFSILDCCHSGGMSRGASSRVRGINPPDDVSHRSLRWDSARQMWAPRNVISPINKGLGEKDRKLGKIEAGIRMETNLGADGITRRIGRGAMGRARETGEVQAIRNELGHSGPYQPLIYHACGEGELAMEYRHGSQSYGAFTYALSLAIRHAGGIGKARKPPTFADLLKDVARRLKDLGYKQTPGIFGPQKIMYGKVPWI